MNREILFRGKKVINGEWVEGDLFQHGEQAFIAADNRNSEVIPKTVGQYTGLTDRNGVRIFEGDILEELNGNQARVVFKDGAFMKLRAGRKVSVPISADVSEVIGNFHDVCQEIYEILKECVEEEDKRNEKSM